MSRQTKSQETSTMTTTNSGTITTPMMGGGQNHVGSQICQDDAPSLKQEETSKSEGTQAGGTLQHTNTLASTKSTSTGNGARTKDYSDEMVCIRAFVRQKFTGFANKLPSLLSFSSTQAHEMHHNILNNNTRRKTKSTENMNVGQ